MVSFRISVTWFVIAIVLVGFLFPVFFGFLSRLCVFLNLVLLYLLLLHKMRGKEPQIYFAACVICFLFPRVIRFLFPPVLLDLFSAFVI